MRIPEVSEPTDLALIARLMLMTYLLIFVIPLSASEHNQPRENAYYEVREVEPDLVEIKVPHTGDVTYKNTSEQIDVSPLREVPEMILDRELIDFESFEDHYAFWQEVYLWDPYVILVGDTDQDGAKEIIAERTYYQIPEGEDSFYATIYELGPDDIFTRVHKFQDSTSHPRWTGDLDNDGKQDIVMNNYFLDDSLYLTQSIRNYEATGPTSFPIEINSEFFPGQGTQTNHATLHDFDRDDQLEMIYYLDGGIPDTCGMSTIIVEYDSTLNQFVFLDCFMQPDFYTSHYAIGDWDMDGQDEFATGSIDGDLYIVECTGPNQYDHTWTGQLETFNAYMSTTTNDINGNGKPELWIGGDHFIPGGAETVISCYEAVADNEYEEIFKFRIPDIFSFYSYGVANTDIDQDGVDELMIWLDDYIYIMKTTGPESYDLIFAHENPLRPAPTTQIYYSVTSKDLTGDGYPELMISMSNNIDVDVDRVWFTKLYQPAGALLGVESFVKPESLMLLAAYPNPFNQSISIQWELEEAQEFELTIYDLKGRKIKQLHSPDNSLRLNNSTIWEGRNSHGEEVATGVYFVKLDSQTEQKVIKIVLIR